MTAEMAAPVPSGSRPRVAVLGAGPVGLDAALAALDAGSPVRIYEAASRPAGHVRRWSHVRLFSPWPLDVSPRMRRHLEAAGHVVPDDDRCPTGAELVESVLDPVAGLPELAPHLRLGTRVVAVGREGLLKHEAIGSEARREHPFRILLSDGSGRECVERADVVLDCTGTYGNPNALGDGGIPAPGEGAVGEAIVREIPDVEAEPEEWRGRTVLVAGAGHSAQTAVRDLAGLPGTRVLWVVRSPDPEFAGIPDDPLPERSRLVREAGELVAEAGSPVELLAGRAVEAVSRSGDAVEVQLREPDGETHTVRADRVLSLTGYVGDHRIYRQLQVHECWATSGPMKLAATLLGQDSADCLAQESHGPETLVNPEPGFFILGSKSYGRNNTFLMRVGWQQVDEVFGLIAGP